MPAPESPTTSPSLLRQLRQRAGLSLSDLARRANLDKGYLSRIERGIQSAPADTVGRIAAEIGRAQSERVA